MGQSVASAKPRRGFKEFVRKFFVSLKRNPHNIALFVMLVTYVFYSLNLSNISNCTAYVNRANMGQCQFVSMLLGILMLVTFLGAFPRREKPKIIMIALTLLMLLACTGCQILYAYRISYALSDPIHPYNPYDASGAVSDQGAYVLAAQAVVTVHIILLIICIALVAALPVYSKLIKKINTSIEVEGNENMVALDMAEDE